MGISINEGRVYSAQDEHGSYRIWPSAKYKDCYYVDRVVFPSNGNMCYAESSKKAFSIDAVNWWIEQYANDVEWIESEWNGEEHNPFDTKHKHGYGKSSTVYFMKAVGTSFVKIGVGGYSRVNELQTGCPFELKIIHLVECQDAYKEEDRLHGLFKKYHHRGEWYYLSSEILKYIKQLNNKKDV
jgi:hypothetical protein